MTFRKELCEFPCLLHPGFPEAGTTDPLLRGLSCVRGQRKEGAGSSGAAQSLLWGKGRHRAVGTSSPLGMGPLPAQ